MSNLDRIDSNQLAPIEEATIDDNSPTQNNIPTAKSNQLLNQQAKLKDLSPTSTTTTNYFLNSSSWLNSILSCLAPILNSFKLDRIGKKLDREEDEWIVPFNLIRKLEFISSGAEGFVYKGILNRRQIAIKRVKDKRETEIAHLKKLKHNNIIRFIGICTTPYCVLMEYCENGTLADLLDKRRFDIEPELIWEFAFQISKFLLSIFFFVVIDYLVIFSYSLLESISNWYELSTF